MHGDVLEAADDTNTPKNSGRAPACKKPNEIALFA
jgi:hypothetical protein